jgi:hypothetical protein
MPWLQRGSYQPSFYLGPGSCGGKISVESQHRRRWGHDRRLPFYAATPVNLNSNFARIDWTINKKMSAFFRINTYYDLQAAGSAAASTLLQAFPDTPGPNVWAHPWAVDPDAKLNNIQPPSD